MNNDIDLSEESLFFNDEKEKQSNDLFDVFNYQDNSVTYQHSNINPFLSIGYQQNELNLNISNRYLDETIIQKESLKNHQLNKSSRIEQAKGLKKKIMNSKLQKQGFWLKKQNRRFIYLLLKEIALSQKDMNIVLLSRLKEVLLLLKFLMFRTRIDICFKSELR